MKCIFTKQHLAGALLAIGLIVGWAGCSFQPENSSVATVVNATDGSLIFTAVERELSHRLYLDSKFPVAAITSGGQGKSTFLLKAGTSVALQKADVMGEYNYEKTLRLFVYEVRSDTAYVEGHLDLTYDELERKDFRVEISEFPQY